MHFIQSHPAFNDTVDSLKQEFKSDTTNTVIICGAHEFSNSHSIDEYKNQYNKIIIFNQEPLLAKQRVFLHSNYFTWLTLADEVWDYDEVNLNVLKMIRSDAKLHILKPYKKWPSTAEKDNDILFYGTLNTHRKDILNSLMNKFKVTVLTNCWDDTVLDQWILRSRILLNLHYFNETALQEQARMIRWIGAPCRIISEPSIHNYLGVEELSVEGIKNL